MRSWCRFGALFTALFVSVRAHPFKTSSFNFTQSNDQPIVACVFNIATLYFGIRSTVGIVEARNSILFQETLMFHSLVREMHAATQWSLINLDSDECLNSYFYREHDCRSNETVVRVDDVIICGNVADVVEFLGNCDVRILTAEGSRFVVALELSQETNVTEDVRRVLNAFWKLDQLDVVVLVLRESKSVDIYSWFPFDQDANPIIMETFSGGTLRDNNDLFPDKTRNLKTFKITFGAVIAAPFACRKLDESFCGFENAIAETLAEKMNFTIAYNFIGSGVTIREEALVSLRIGESDVTLGGFLETPERFKNFGPTVTFFRDSVQWYVGGDWSISESHWPEGVIAYNGMIFVVIAISMQFIATETSEDSRIPRQSTWLIVWSLFVEVGTQGRYLLWRQKFLWTLCAFYSLNMNALMKSVITSVMTQPLYGAKIKTTHQLYKSDIPIMHSSPNTPGTDFPNEESVDLEYIAKRTRACRDSGARGRRICISEKLSEGPIGITSLTTMMKVITETSPPGSFHTLDRSIVVYQFTSYTRKNHFLISKFRDHMGRFIEVGLVQYWHATFETHSECDIARAEWKHSDVLTDPSAYQPVSFRRIEQVVGTVVVGYGLSCFVFWLEILFARWRHTLAVTVAFFKRLGGMKS